MIAFLSLLLVALDADQKNVIAFLSLLLVALDADQKNVFTTLCSWKRDSTCTWWLKNLFQHQLKMDEWDLDMDGLKHNRTRKRGGH